MEDRAHKDLGKLLVCLKDLLYNQHMRLSDEFNENDNKSGLPVVYMMLGALAFVIVVVVIVMAVNDSGKRRKGYYKNTVADQTADEFTDIDTTDMLGDPDLTADDLDFWNMYKDDRQVSDNSVITDKSYEERLREMEQAEEEKAIEEDLSEGGTKTKVIRPDGSEQWIMINAYIDKNPYLEEGFVFNDPLMKYYTQGKSISVQGITLSESNGKPDFALLKQDGISFVMLRYGYRGYESGQIKKDTLFDDNFASAKAAGMDIGIYFESSAVTTDESAQEADFLLKGLSEAADSQSPSDQRIDYNAQNAATPVFGNADEAVQTAGDAAADGDQNTDISDSVVVEQIGPSATREAVSQEGMMEPLQLEAPVSLNPSVTYPVAIKLGQPQNHSSRTDNMPKTVISQCANAFLDKVTGLGYKGCVWGDKYWLLRRVDLTQLTSGTEIILEQSGEKPDYPYNFSLWQYKQDAAVSGIKGDAQMMISFVDYRSQ